MQQTHEILSALFSIFFAPWHGSGEFTLRRTRTDAAGAPLALPRRQTNTPVGGTMSLEDCIQEALAHNFDVQIERYDPQISLYNLNAAYARL